MKLFQHIQIIITITGNYEISFFVVEYLLKQDFSKLFLKIIAFITNDENIL